MDLLGSIVVGVVASMTASVVFLWFLTRLRPKIRICPGIARELGADGMPQYRIKIVNIGRRPAVDVCVQIFRETIYNAPDGPNLRLKPLQGKSEANVLPARKRGDIFTRHAKRIRLVADLDAEWTDDEVQSVLVRVFARDALSGFGREFEQHFRKRTAIRDGAFRVGDSCEIA